MILTSKTLMRTIYGDNWAFIDDNWKISTVEYPDFQIEQENGETILKSYTGHDDIIHIPPGITRIAESVFWRNDCTKVVMPDSVKIIRNLAFADCSKLEEVVFSSNLTEIHSSVFEKCASLHTVDLSKTKVKSISKGAFSVCVNLSDVKLPNTLKTIYSYAFSCCISLKDIVLPDSVTFLGERAFENCANLGNIQVPTKKPTLEKHIFDGCPALETISVFKNDDIETYVFPEDLNNFYKLIRR